MFNSLNSITFVPLQPVTSSLHHFNLLIECIYKVCVCLLECELFCPLTNGSISTHTSVQGETLHDVTLMAVEETGGNEQ